MRIDTPASKIIRIAADKLGLRSDQPDDLKLCEVKSTGGENSSFTDREEEEIRLRVSLRTNDLQRKWFEYFLWIVIERSIVFISCWASRCLGKWRRKRRWWGSNVIQVALPEQDGPSRGTWQRLEMFGSKELAYAITMQDYELFMSINQVDQSRCRSSKWMSWIV